MIEDLESLEPLERMKMIIAMSEYITPKFSRIVQTNIETIEQKRKTVSDLFPTDEEIIKGLED